MTPQEENKLLMAAAAAKRYYIANKDGAGFKVGGEPVDNGNPMPIMVPPGSSLEITNPTGETLDISVPTGESLPVEEQAPIWNRGTPRVQIVTAQELTGVLANYGSVLDMRGFTHLVIDVQGDHNTSQNVILKLFNVIDARTSEIVQGGSIQEEELWGVDIEDTDRTYEFEVGGIDFVQLQAFAGIVGTAGDLTIGISKIWR